jgi:hypothetical protein
MIGAVFEFIAGIFVDIIFAKMFGGLQRGLVRAGVPEWLGGWLIALMLLGLAALLIWIVFHP